MRKIVFILLTFAGLSSCQESFQNRLSKEAEEFSNAHCPFMVSADMRLDSMKYDTKENILTRYFTWMGDDKTFSKHIAQKADSVEIVLRKELLQDMGWKECIDRGVIFRYIYYGESTKKALFTTDIDIRKE